VNDRYEKKSDEVSSAAVYVRTALYVLLVAAGVFAGLQAHQFITRKHEEARDLADGRMDSAGLDDLAALTNTPSGIVGLVPVEALPPVPPPAEASLWFALGRHAEEPGNVQLIWLYRGELSGEDVAEHYRQAFREAGYAFMGDKAVQAEASDRHTLVFMQNGSVAIVSVRTGADDEKIERFTLTINRPAQEGDFAAAAETPLSDGM
jgi:hypothetical protein